MKEKVENKKGDLHKKAGQEQVHHVHHKPLHHDKPVVHHTKREKHVEAKHAVHHHFPKKLHNEKKNAEKVEHKHHHFHHKKHSPERKPEVSIDREYNQIKARLENVGEVVRDSAPDSYLEEDNSTFQEDKSTFRDSGVGKIYERKKIVKNYEHEIKRLPVKIVEKINDNRPNSEELRKHAELIVKMKSEISKGVTGQEKIVDSLIMALLCDGHVLLEGVPGIAKTLAIKTLGVVSGCSVERIQFTVDLLPTDITGITTYTPGKGFETIKGPIFSNFIIADEINRSPSKTQSALIEAMQEMQVTIAKETFKLPIPFFVMATQNPLEQSGVYMLPEAQIDRFLFKLIMSYPKYSEEKKIMEENMTLKKFEEFGIKSIVSPADILKMQKLTKRIFLDDKIKSYILNIVKRTRTKDFKYGEYIEWGSSPRASIALFIASKAKALMSGRNFVVPSDVRGVVHDVMRHRVILNYRARAEGVDSDKVIDEILAAENV